MEKNENYREKFLSSLVYSGFSFILFYEVKFLFMLNATKLLQ